MGEAIITVSQPRREDGTDNVKFTLNPRVDNYNEVATTVEGYLKDKSIFSTWKHVPGKGTWMGFLVAGMKLDTFHFEIANRLNQQLPPNVKAIAEGAIPLFDEDEIEPDDGCERISKVMLEELLSQVSRVSGELEESIDALTKAKAMVDEIRKRLAYDDLDA